MLLELCLRLLEASNHPPQCCSCCFVGLLLTGLLSRARRRRQHLVQHCAGRAARCRYCLCASPLSCPAEQGRMAAPALTNIG